jgi:hypothetical protein
MAEKAETVSHLPHPKDSENTYPLANLNEVPGALYGFLPASEEGEHLSEKYRLHCMQTPI